MTKNATPSTASKFAAHSTTLGRKRTRRAEVPFASSKGILTGSKTHLCNRNREVRGVSSRMRRIHQPRKELGVCRIYAHRCR